ncbi:MAG TPA: Maf family protein [Bryobacteraceae bacterium]|nr:Maf family protein [Bryobacteraceae bacterium]
MLVLASQSPRRSEILRQAGISFIVKPAGVDESVHPGEKPEAYVMRVARAKATAVETGAEDIVLGADTVVIVGNEMLGKPRDAADAARMLARLAGREHQVITGICLRRNTASREDRAITRVWFRKITPAEISSYVASGEPLDKAGAYAIQGLAAKFVERIEGSYTNVVGLPIELVRQHLREFENA